MVERIGRERKVNKHKRREDWRTEVCRKPRLPVSGIRNPSILTTGALGHTHAGVPWRGGTDYEIWPPPARRDARYKADMCWWTGRGGGGENKSCRHCAWHVEHLPRQVPIRVVWAEDAGLNQPSCEENVRPGKAKKSRSRAWSRKRTKGTRKTREWEMEGGGGGDLHWKVSSEFLISCTHPPPPPPQDAAAPWPISFPLLERAQRQPHNK